MPGEKQTPSRGPTPDLRIPCPVSRMLPFGGFDVPGKKPADDERKLPVIWRIKRQERQTKDIRENPAFQDVPETKGLSV